MDGHGDGPRLKNGPALTGHGAEAVRDAISDALDAVALALNTRPRKTLGWKTPADALDQVLRSA